MPRKKKAPPPRLQLSPNFWLDEFQSSKDEYQVKRGDIDQALLDHLELMRTIGGNAPIIINSGYRSPEYNEVCGGVENSAHTRGRAADLKVAGGHDRYRLLVSHTLACAVESHGMSIGKAIELFKCISQTFGGFGLAKSFIHVDVEVPGGDLPRPGSRPGSWGY